MKILTNPKDEEYYCDCSEGYGITTDWGSKYCLINKEGMCICKGRNGPHYLHSKEALLVTPNRCAICGSALFILGKHP